MALSRLFAIVTLCLPLLATAQNAVELGRNAFESRCARCHGADGSGGEMGPALAPRLERLSDVQLQTTIVQGLPTRGMPPHDVQEPELSQLIAFLRSIRPRPASFESYRMSAVLTDGDSIAGTVMAEGADDVQLLGDEHRLHLLRRAGKRFREVTSQTDWSGYNGDPGGNRFTSLKQISRVNVQKLAPRWIFPMPNAAGLEVTPAVFGGVMYVTRANECFALDAGTGRQIWHYQRARTRGLIGNAAGGINRGVAVSGGRVFMLTDDAHLLALDRFDGHLLWDTPMADWRENYNATSAPLVVGNRVFAGSAGGEEGVRGFLAAYDAQNGAELWRFWTVPKPGEAGAETWQGKGIEHGGAPAWFTGVYDASTDTLFWETGNPGNDYNGQERGGDNLYTDCILALDPATGRLKWYFQTTPHDVWDWDASETPLVIDAVFAGTPRKLLVQGNRNGFFYMLDRITGEMLLARQFVDELTWARGIASDGRPELLAGQEPSVEGSRVCPSQAGATNWYSPSFNPATGLFYLQTAERCSIYRRREDQFQAGRSLLGGTVRTDATPKPVKILRALEVTSGVVRWQIRQVGLSSTSGGTLTSAGGLVFYGDDSGALGAADARTGKQLWLSHLGANWRASPMAFEFDHEEMIAVAAGGNIIAFALTPAHACALHNACHRARAIDEAAPAQ